jgi:RNA polymerase sigma-70 factor, ECF subfamily
MRQFCRGEARAFDALFERYARPLNRYLARLVGASAADDLTQATFLSVVRARGRFRDGARVKPWMYAIATNAARDWMRRQRPEDLSSDGELPNVADTAESVMRDLGLERTVATALEQLTGSQREAILLHKFEGMSFAEIADSLGVTESTVKVRAHRGYEKLRVLLADLKELS